MNYRSILVIAFLLFICFTGISQEIFSPKIRYFDENSGFESTDFISDVRVDSKGLVWIVNLDRITTYDGVQFKNINTSTVSHASLLRFFESKGGKKYLIDYLGAIFFIEDDTLREYEYNNILKKFKARNGFTSVYFDKEDRLHISYRGIGYIIIDKGKLNYPLKELGKKFNGDVIILKKDREPFFTQVIGDTLISKSKFLYSLDSNYNLIDSIKLNKAKNTLPYSLSKYKNSYLLSDGKSNLIHINKEGELDLYSDGLPISNILIDDKGGVWISSPNKGVKYYNSIHSLKESRVKLLGNYTATASAIDKDGGIWVYSSEKGLAYIGYPDYKYYSSNGEYSFSNSIYGIEKVGNLLYFTDEGTTLYMIDETNYKLDSILLDIPKDHIVYEIYYDKLKKNYWIACRGALFYGDIKSNKWTKLKTSKLEYKPGSIYKILGRNRDLNAMVFALNEQYFYVRDSTVQFISKQYPNVIFDVETYGDSVIVGAEDGVYIEYKGKTEILSKNYPNLSERVYSITKVEDKLYVSQRKVGLYEIKSDIVKEVSYRGEIIKKAAVFKKSNSSLLIIAKQGSFTLEDDSLRLYARLPRIVSGKFIYRDSSIYWGTWKEGVLKTPLSHILQNSYKSPDFYVNRILIDGINHPIESKEFEIDYTKGLFQFYFSAISFQNWDIKYRYRLLGLNNQWTETDERNVQYTTLPSGDYTFQVQAKRGNQFWSDSIEYSFKVLPPFWKTWWFTILLILFLFIGSYFLINTRILRIKREKDLVIDRLQAEQRALRSQMNPHFVFNIVSSAQYLVLKEQNQRAIDFLGRFSKLMRSILDYSDTSLIPIEEEIDFLKNYIELEQMRMEDAFDFEINMEGKLNSLLVPPFLIQPFIENSIHHGLKDKDGERQIELSLKSDNNFIIVTIKDNGIGRNSASEHMSEAKKNRKSHAIRIIKERLELNNNRKANNLQITDLFDKKGKAIGTKVELKIKI